MKLEFTFCSVGVEDIRTGNIVWGGIRRKGNRGNPDYRFEMHVTGPDGKLHKGVFKSKREARSAAREIWKEEA